MNTLAVMCIALTSTRPSCTPLSATSRSTSSWIDTIARRWGTFIHSSLVSDFMMTNAMSQNQTVETPTSDTCSGFEDEYLEPDAVNDPFAFAVQLAEELANTESRSRLEVPTQYQRRLLTTLST